MIYLCPPRVLEHSAQAKCPRCQCLPSASVHSSDKMSWNLHKLSADVFWHFVTSLPRRKLSSVVLTSRRDVAHKRGVHLHRSRWGPLKVRCKPSSKNSWDATVSQGRLGQRWHAGHSGSRSTVDGGIKYLLNYGLWKLVEMIIMDPATYIMFQFCCQPQVLHERKYFFAFQVSKGRKIREGNEIYSQHFWHSFVCVSPLEIPSQILMTFSTLFIFLCFVRWSRLGRKLMRSWKGQKCQAFKNDSAGKVHLKMLMESTIHLFAKYRVSKQINKCCNCDIFDRF